MNLPMHKNKSVSAHTFAMIPKPDVPRSTFMVQKAHKTTFDAGYLVPFYLAEVLPGDTFHLQATLFARLATPLFPVMDNMKLETQFWFVPYRLVWSNWKKFMGEQDNPADTISYTIPQMVSKASGYDINSLQDYMGLPTLGQVTAGQTVSHSALPLRAYNLIYNTWYRDENLQNSVVVDLGDAASVYTDYSLLRRGKRPDYFTTALPWPQKGNTASTIPIGTSAPVKYGPDIAGTSYVDKYYIAQNTGGTFEHAQAATIDTAGATIAAGAQSNLYADLSTATAATINQLRSSIAIQQLLEKDARGGTRYTEIIRQQFGVVSPDARLQRPEYLGGGSSPITINPVAQTSGTSASGTTTPLATLGGVGAVAAPNHGFQQSFTEHGIVIGIVSIRADLTYQQGIQRFWNRSTRYDFYTPVFANLGEQTILNKEIYCKGDATADDSAVFGYQERWAEYRYDPSMITGLFRSTAAGAIDGWHLAQKFTSLPTLNTTFIQDTPPVSRVVAVGAAANGQQFIFDSFIQNKMARPMPLYSVPGLNRL